MIENLNGIREVGLVRFMEIENSRWVCLNCGSPMCVHIKKGYNCEKGIYSHSASVGGRKPSAFISKVTSSL